MLNYTFFRQASEFERAKVFAFSFPKLISSSLVGGTDQGRAMSTVHKPSCLWESTSSAQKCLDDKVLLSSETTTIYEIIMLGPQHHIHIYSARTLVHLLKTWSTSAVLAHHLLAMRGGKGLQLFRNAKNFLTCTFARPVFVTVLKRIKTTEQLIVKTFT